MEEITNVYRSGYILSSTVIVKHTLMEMEGTEAHIVIVGAGVAGLATALGLHRLGLRSLVLESSDQLRSTGFTLGIWQNGWKALDALGIGDSLSQDHPLILRLKDFSAISGQVIRDRPFCDKETAQNGFEFRVVGRMKLLETMANELPEGTIRYSSKLVAIDESGHLKIVHLSDGSVLKAKVLIGCDGVNSVVARWLGLEKPRFTGRVAVRGHLNYKQEHGLEFQFKQFIGNGWRSGMVPYSHTSLHWFFTWAPSPQEKEMEHDPVKIKQFLLSRLGKLPENVRAVFEMTELDNLVMTPLRYRHPWDLAWRSINKGNVCVAGDAFHPMTPDLAQGGCAALEDGVVLARCLGQALQNNHDNWKLSIGREWERIETGLKNYARERRWRGITLLATAWFIGYMEQGTGALLSFMRKRVLSVYLAKLLAYFTRFDCGNLRSA